MNLPVNQMKEMTIGLAPGEILFYLDLHAITSHTPAEVFKLAESLGFPVKEIRYRVLDDGTVGLYAILHQEQRDPAGMLEWNYICNEVHYELWNAIQPELTVHLRYRLEGGREVEPDLETIPAA